jgi:hypothetical protein
LEDAWKEARGLSGWAPTLFFFPGLHPGDQFGERDDFTAARAHPARTDPAGERVAVRAVLLAHQTGVAVGALIDGALAPAVGWREGGRGWLVAPPPVGSLAVGVAAPLLLACAEGFAAHPAPSRNPDVTRRSMTCVPARCIVIARHCAGLVQESAHDGALTVRDRVGEDGRRGRSPRPSAP